jgi:hypothetical protein
MILEINGKESVEWCADLQITSVTGFSVFWIEFHASLCGWGSGLFQLWHWCVYDRGVVPSWGRCAIEWCSFGNIATVSGHAMFWIHCRTSSLQGYCLGTGACCSR